MATVSKRVRKVHYPDSDGKPVGETPIHVCNLLYAFYSLRQYFGDRPRVYVAGNMFVYYEEGNPRKHVSPDVFAVRGIKPKTDFERRNYLVWEEGKAPEMVVEVTSKSTRAEDITKKMALYRDTLGVLEYFLFDPYGEYLDPRLQGYRLRQGTYAAIRPVKGRLPSQVLGLHLEAVEEMLRFFDPKTLLRVPIPTEYPESLRRAEAERQRAEEERQQAEVEKHRAEEARQQAEVEKHRAETERGEAEAAQHRAEVEADRLRRELEELRRKLSGA
jgi:Uma2 family endonuclease